MSLNMLRLIKKKYIKDSNWQQKKKNNHTCAIQLNGFVPCSPMDFKFTKPSKGSLRQVSNLPIYTPLTHTHDHNLFQYRLDWDYLVRWSNLKSPNYSVHTSWFPHRFLFIYYNETYIIQRPFTWDYDGTFLAWTYNWYCSCVRIIRVFVISLIYFLCVFFRCLEYLWSFLDIFRTVIYSG